MKERLILKSMLVWAGIIPLAILNGGLREAVLIPALGNIALPVSGILLAMMAFILSYLSLPRLGAGTQRTYIQMGAVWLCATVVFEFVLGLATGEAFSGLLAAYNIFTGNLWSLVVLFIGCTPWLTAKAKHMI